MQPCWECGTVGEVHHHHPVPKSRGGTRTIPLCLRCHGKAHGRKMSTSQLTKDGLRALQARGVKLGRPCYGRTDDERALVARAVDLREQGLTLHQVAATLDDEGYKARNGAALSVSTIHRITKRAAVAA